MKKLASIPKPLASPNFDLITSLAEELIDGSIVEGVDYGTEEHYLKWPFTKEVFWETVEAVDDEANSIWEETHGCEHCWSGEPNMEFISKYDMRPIDKNCPHCKGEGIML